LTSARCWGGHHGVDEVELVGVVDHDRDGGTGGVVPDQRAQRTAVHGRVGDQQVVVAELGEPQRLGQRERHRALARRVGQGPVQRPAAAQRLRGDPDRGAARASGEVGGVGLEGGEVEDREGRVEVRGGGVEVHRALAVTHPVGDDQLVAVGVGQPAIGHQLGQHAGDVTSRLPGRGGQHPHQPDLRAP
jgi:hypothetical protein